MLKTVKVKSINCPQSNPHIRPAWLSLEPNSPIQKLNCEVDTEAGCNVLPYNILKSTFGHVTLKPATECIVAYDDNAVKVMGSCIIHAHSGKTGKTGVSSHQNRRLLHPWERHSHEDELCQLF